MGVMPSGDGRRKMWGSVSDEVWGKVLIYDGVERASAGLFVEKRGERGTGSRRRRSRKKKVGREKPADWEGEER